MTGANMLQEKLRSVLQPIEHAHGLPNAAYVDGEFYIQERERVFDRSWVCIGLASDAPEPGSVFPLTFQDRPLLMVRDRHGTVRVFHNVCRHRGMILVDHASTLPGVIRCPYHSWCYGLDGTLKMTPHVGGPGRNQVDTIDPALTGLREVSSHVWLGLVFANIDGRARSFDVEHQTIMQRWQAFDSAPLFTADCSLSFDLEANWKLAIENYCESYHLPWIHPSLNSYSKLEDHYNIVQPGRFSGQGTHKYAPLLTEDGKRFTAHEPLPVFWSEGAEYISLYPNALLGIHRDHLFAMIIEPRAADRTHERVEIQFFDRAAIDDGHADLRSRLASNWRDVFAEDVPVVEGMHRGRASPGFDGGVFSPVMDTPTHCFHQWIAENLLDPVATAALAAE